MHLSSFYPVLMTERVIESRDFYTTHFGFDISFESDWYISLKHPTNNYELAILRPDHETVPDKFRTATSGLILNFEVADVNALHAKLVTDAQLPVALPIRDEDFGQRHFIVVDPNGVLIDVITPIEPTAEFAAQYTS
ncbi:MAG: glyoxalase/bleomycin resistance/extradiol dioxygenase family protein [Corynebacteriales bacterium]|nr:glyoxalase/bleomycin resistance/extradiol dioxygenase family protein [Mycobacteriales bacterium]